MFTLSSVFVGMGELVTLFVWENVAVMGMGKGRKGTRSECFDRNEGSICVGMEWNPMLRTVGIYCGISPLLKCHVVGDLQIREAY